LKSVKKDYLKDSILLLFQKFLKGSLTVLGVSVFARLIGLVKEIVIAREFGLSSELDTYFLAIMIPMYLVVSFTNPLGPVFIPTFNRDEKEGLEKGQLLFSKLLTYVIYGALALAILFGLLIPGLDFLLNVSETNLVLFQNISLVFIPIVVIQSISNYLLAFLENRKHFIFTSLGAVLSSVFVLVSVLLFHSIMSIALAMLLSAIVFLLIEIAMLNSKGRIKLTVNWELKSLQPSFKKQYVWLFLASITMGSTLVVDQFMASYFGESSVSGLNYGYRLAGIVSSMGALTLGAVALPVFSKLIAENEKEKISGLLHSLLLGVGIISLPVVALIYFNSNTITSLLFQRGAFQSMNVALVSDFLKLYIFQFPFYVAGIVISRLMSSLGKNNSVFVISLLALVLNVTLNIGFTKWIGISGIALSTSVVYLFTFLALYFSSRRALKTVSE